MSITTLAQYKNGDYDIELFSDGTLIKTSYIDNPQVKSPTNIDIKLTNYCTMGCSYCHENSTSKGKQGDLNRLVKLLSELPRGTEVALGGGDTLSHSDIIPFLRQIGELGIIPNITVNQGHLKKQYDLIKYLLDEKLVYGVGISVTNDNFTTIEKLKEVSDNIVYHVIAGVNNISVMDKLIALGSPKILVLGYKQYGLGIDYYSDSVEQNIRQWYMYLPRYITKTVLSFDNLAIEQLNIKRLFTDEGWQTFYMGDDFTQSMYIDSVNQEFAPTSRSLDRQSFKDYTLLEYFNTFKNKC